VRTVAVNAHWQAGAVAGHLLHRPAPPQTVLLREELLLDTGGGVQAALHVLGADPFFVVNGDAFWLNGPLSALLRLTTAFDDSIDGVLLVHRTSHVHADVGYGDFALDKWGIPSRRKEREVVPYIYAGVQLIHPRLLNGMPPAGAFSMNRAWDSALAAGRLRAVVHDGIWFHLSTPPDLAEAEQILEARFTGDARWPWR
jgi:N-acetyl-alpha-D-muramate 1-phosphate uridylyltransferase